MGLQGDRAGPLGDLLSGQLRGRDDQDLGSGYEPETASVTCKVRVSFLGQPLMVRKMAIRAVPSAARVRDPQLRRLLL